MRAARKTSNTQHLATQVPPGVSNLHRNSKCELTKYVIWEKRVLLIPRKAQGRRNNVVASVLPPTHRTEHCSAKNSKRPRGNSAATYYRFSPCPSTASQINRSQETRLTPLAPQWGGRHVYPGGGKSTHRSLGYDLLQVQSPPQQLAVMVSHSRRT